jgi:hypothetical protein
MLVYNPYYLVYDMGFLLSFFAVIGIIWAEKKSVMLNSFQHLKQERFSPKKQGRAPALLHEVAKTSHKGSSRGPKGLALRHFLWSLASRQFRMTHEMTK